MTRTKRCVVAKSLISQATAGLKCCNDVRPMVVYLEHLAAIQPELKPLVDEQKSKLDTLQQLCQIVIDLEETPPEE